MPWPKGQPRSQITKDRISATRTGGHLTERQRYNLSVAKTGKVNPISLEAKSRLANNFRGGVMGDEFARVLCPVGFVREHVVQFGREPGQNYHLDFAEPKLKVCIELDGITHYASKEADEKRDTFLREQGWIVIRIPHGL